MPAKQPVMSPSDQPVEEVLDRITGPRRAEADELVALCEEVSGEQPVVWAGRIIGFGEHQYPNANGQTVRVPLLAFASNSTKHTIYLAEDFSIRWRDLVADLGKHKASKVCLYISRLSDVDQDVLHTLLERTLADV